MNKLYYSNPQAAAMFGVSIETVRSWSLEFEQYLSPSANPGAKRRRQFTEEDLSVFALIHELKGKGFKFPDIHAALENGQRGNIAVPLPQEVDTLALATRDQLLMEIKRQRHEIDRLTKTLEATQTTHEEALVLQARLEATQAQLTEIKAELKVSQTTIQELSTKAGEQYARGYVEGFDRRKTSEDN